MIRHALMGMQMGKRVKRYTDCSDARLGAGRLVKRGNAQLLVGTTARIICSSYETNSMFIRANLSVDTNATRWLVSQKK
jgi:hypothetical protein